MNFADVPVPQVYKDSADFRFFLKWIEICLTKYRHDTDNLIDLLDPLRCPARLLWLLGGTCGYVYDEALGDPDNGIEPGTKFEDLPDDFECPMCSVGKEEFSLEEE